MGWLSEKPGSVILREEIEEIKENRYTLLMFVLATQADQNIVSAIQRQWRDIHYLTGRRILFIAFYNARPEDYKVYSPYYPSRSVDPRLKNLLGMQPDTIDTDRFMSSMTEESYELARRLGIPLSSLPCCAFFETHNVETYQVLDLKGFDEHDLSRTLRHFVSGYYGSTQNRDYFRSLERLEEFEQKRTSLVRRLRQLPEELAQELVQTNSRIQQLQTQLPVKEEHTSNSIRNTLFEDTRLSERDRLAKELGLTEVQGKLDSLRIILSSSDPKDIIWKWVLNAERDLLQAVISEQFLPQIERFVEDLGNGQLQKEDTQLWIQINSGDINQQKKIELSNQQEEIRVRRKQVGNTLFQLLYHDSVIDTKKAKDKIKSLKQQKQLLVSNVSEQINELASSRLETAIEAALTMLRDSTNKEITRLQEIVQRLSTGNEAVMIQQEMESVNKEIQMLRQKVNSTHADGFGILRALNRGTSVRRVASSPVCHNG